MRKGEGGGGGPTIDRWWKGGRDSLVTPRIISIHSFIFMTKLTYDILFE